MRTAKTGEHLLAIQQNVQRSKTCGAISSLNSYTENHLTVVNDNITEILALDFPKWKTEALLNVATFVNELLLVCMWRCGLELNIL